jgi:gliding motility-associated-like protein
MKISSIYLLFLSLCFPYKLFSQACTNPLPPVLTLVSVQPETGYTDFRWTLSPSSNVAAYLIYAYHNESGIPRGDIIDTIWDATSTSFTYKSTVSTYYTVSFVISSFRTPNCTSSFSNVINTIYASASLDTCNKRIKISWNSYPSSPKRVVSYTILAGVNGNPLNSIADVQPDQTSYILNDFQSNAQYCFLIRANLEDGTVSTSNKACLSTKMQQPPGWINADYATVDVNSQINLSFTIDPASRINNFRLERMSDNENSFTQISVFNTTSRQITYSDHSADPSRRNYYRMLAVNNCGNAIVTSNYSNNIVASLSSDNNIITLGWNTYRNWRGVNGEYNVFINTGTGFRELASLSPQDSSYKISYSGIMYELSDKKVCFYISAKEKGNPYLVNGITRSAEICTEINERITVPNTFTPNDDLKNDLFKPVLSFTPVDYHLIITDRQNRTLFESRDFNAEWNGKANGQPQPEGVYLWYLSVRSPSGKVFTRKGTITIVR